MTGLIIGLLIGFLITTLAREFKRVDLTGLPTPTIPFAHRLPPEARGHPSWGDLAEPTEPEFPSPEGSDYWLNRPDAWPNF